MTYAYAARASKSQNRYPTEPKGDGRGGDGEARTQAQQSEARTDSKSETIDEIGEREHSEPRRKRPFSGHRRVHSVLMPHQLIFPQAIR